MVFTAVRAGWYPKLGAASKPHSAPGALHGRLPMAAAGTRKKG
jgi:hypothetical protein